MPFSSKSNVKLEDRILFDTLQIQFPGFDLCQSDGLPVSIYRRPAGLIYVKPGKLKSVDDIAYGELFQGVPCEAHAGLSWHS